MPIIPQRSDYYHRFKSMHLVVDALKVQRNSNPITDCHAWRTQKWNDRTDHSVQYINKP